MVLLGKYGAQAMEISIPHDARRSERRPVTQQVHLLDAYSRDLVGSLVNLSRHGFMLLCNAPVEPNQVLTLEVERPEQQDRGAPLVFQACCIWCQKSSFSDEYGAGFEIRNISPYDQHRLGELIGRW